MHNVSHERRYDIDWIRVIAIGLLLVYHVAIGFQPWGIMIGFIRNDRTWPSLWTAMSLLNVWRIPLLFFVSGMGVYFALRNRNCLQLLRDRAQRILLPFLFGIVAIVPIHVCLWQYHYRFGIRYSPSPGHLWFLGNLFTYVLILLPVFLFLKRQEGTPLAHRCSRLLRTPVGLLPMFILFIAEVWILRPVPFEMYAMTWHGFFLGLLAFSFGYFFVWCGRPFWHMLLRWWWLFLVVAVGLFVLRLTLFNSAPPGYLLSLESNCWILTIFALGYRHLNHPSRALGYLSKAAYPVYILHMIFLYLGSLVIFPLPIPVPAQYLLLLLFTLAGCLGTYEWVIRRTRILRPLFGLGVPEKRDAG